jgi:SPASM domain peptide maturase of grasp-with-spasm system
MDKAKYLRVFTDCQLVDGDNGYLIYDLRRYKLHSLSQTAYDVLKEIDGKSVDSIISKFGNDIIKIIDYYIAEEVCFLTDSPTSFPKISEDVYFKNECYSAIIEIGASTNYDYVKVINELNQLGCQMLMLSIKPDSDITSEEISKIFNATSDSFLRVIDVVVPSSFENIFSMSFINQNIRICSITYLGSEQLKNEQNENNVLIKRIKDEELNWTEKIVPANFTFSLKSFMESKKYNIALNRKICVDEFGFIRNYINHQEHFGNLSDTSTSINQVFRSSEFQKKWKISNDLIEKCRSCKFRYCCFSNTDLRYSNEKWYKVNSCQVFEPVKESAN